MGSRISTWMKQHSLVAYFVLAYGITWAIGIPLAVSAQSPLDAQISPKVHLFTAFGPMLAAFIVTGMTGGARGVRELVRRMTWWRVGIGWILIAALSPLVLFVFSTLIVGMTGEVVPDLGQFGYVEELPQLGWLLGWVFSILTFGIGEEVGWRGFALPRLQKDRSALSATLILTAFWALWHLPMFFYRQTYLNMGFGGLLMWVFLALLPGAIVFTWLYNSTSGSILMVTLFHGANNAAQAGGQADVVTIMSVFYVIAAVIIVIVAKPANLSRSRRHTI